VNLHDNSGQRWSDEEILMLRQLLSEDVDLADITDVLGRSTEAITYMRNRIRYETAAELHCPRCGQVRPASQFRPSQRFSGGYCTSCARSYERRTEQTEALAVD
jgi:hypothetical protein